MLLFGAIVAAASVATAFFAGTRSGETVTPAGTEFRVNTTIVNTQRIWFETPGAVAMDAAGSSVVTWTSSGQDGSLDGVYAQRYDADRIPQGPEFQVNTTITNDQRRSSVAMDTTGNFVIVWASNGQDGSGWGVYAQQYNAGGAPQGSEFLVNTTTANSQG